VTSRPATYTVRPGDSLSAISARLFGSADKWPYFYYANERVVGGDPDMIVAGQVLQDRLGSHPAYGRATAHGGAIVATAYHAADPPRDPWDGQHHECGDGDGDGLDMPCSYLHGGASNGSASSVGTRAGDSYSGGSYGRVSPGSYSGFQACVIARESGGNSQVMNSTGHYGLYQFSSATWAAYGGNPADFGRASVAEQNQVFGNAIAQGGQSNWAPYDGC
jgi:Transglycosylase-like domain/LysM domain